MKIEKITSGFVFQTYDTESGKWISQTFVSDGNESKYINSLGNLVCTRITNQIKEKGSCLPFNMIQPYQLESVREQIQQDLLTYLDGMSDEVQTKVCQIVVDNFKGLV